MAQSPRWRQVEALFYAAIELASDDRSAFLAQRCESDPDLRAEVESLLLSYDKADDASRFLDKPILDVVKAVSAEPSPALVPGIHLAHYQIISPLGGGGMGEVYLAQDRRLKRKVALKVLSPKLTQNARARTPL